MSNKESIKADLINTAHQVDRLKLITATSGNISARLNKHKFIISGSGIFLGSLEEEYISTCNINTPDKHEGIKPSMEKNLHREIYKKREDVNAALHFQSLYATTLACTSDHDINLNFIPETTVYIKHISIIPYCMPGSKELADEVMRRAEKTDIFILRNHGQIAVGKDLADVLKKASIFEFACNMIYLADGRIKRLSEKSIDELIKNYGEYF